MTKDNTEATRSSGSGELNLADAEQLFRSVHACAVESGCGPHFLSVLQHLLVIPAIDKLGAKLVSRGPAQRPCVRKGVGGWRR